MKPSTEHADRNGLVRSLVAGILVLILGALFCM